VAAVVAFMLSSGVVAMRADYRWWKIALILFASCAITYVSVPTSYGINPPFGAVVLAGLSGIVVVGASVARDRWSTSHVAALVALLAAVTGWWPLFAGALRRILLSGYSADYGIGATVAWLKEFTAILTLATLLNLVAALAWRVARHGGKVGGAA
jgi:hypothetical protein